MAIGNSFEFGETLGGAGKVEQQTGGEIPGVVSAGNETGPAVTEDGSASASFDPDAPLGRLPNGEPRKRRFSTRTRAGSSDPQNPEQAAGKPKYKADKKLALDFKPNERPKVFLNIHGMHQAAAMLAKQPILLLNEAEAKALTDSLCDVLDYHKINITDVTGPWALYVGLGLTCFALYQPRILAIKRGGQQIESPTAPATPAEAEFRAAGMRPMDFTGDLDPNQIN